MVKSTIECHGYNSRSSLHRNLEIWYPTEHGCYQVEITNSKWIRMGALALALTLALLDHTTSQGKY